jgi:membrane-associated phospholipid phosphatase
MVFMFEALETGFGLDVILWLQSLRGSVLEILVKLLDYMGEEMLYIALIALVYWLFNKQLGIRLVFILLVISFLTSFMKDSFATERPYEVSEAVNEMLQESSYGIPSGHVTISLAVWGYLAYALRRRWVWALVIVYVLLQSMGRMVAGVHYPQDILFAWLLGGIVLALYIPLAERVGGIWQNASSSLRLGMILGSLVLILAAVYLINLKGTASPLLISQPEPCPEGAELLDGRCSKGIELETYFTSIGLLLGALAGIWFEPTAVQFKPHSELRRRLGQYLIGVAISVLLLTLLGLVAKAISETGLTAYGLRVLRYGLVTFFALGLWPWISIRIGLMEQDSGLIPVAKAA